MAEITSSPTVSIQSLLYPTTSDTQTTTQTTQSSPTVTTTVVPTDTSILPTSGRGYSAATLGLTPPRPGGSAEADLLSLRQMLEDMNIDNRDNEIMASTQRKATALGGALALLGGMVSSISTYIALTVELPYAEAEANRTLGVYQAAQAATSKAKEDLAPVKTEFDTLTNTISSAKDAIKNLDGWIEAKTGEIGSANGELTQANTDLSIIDGNIKNQEKLISDLRTAYNNAKPADRPAIVQQINDATFTLENLKTSYTNKQTDIGNINTRIENLNTEKTNYENARAERVKERDNAQTRLDEITPTKIQLEEAVATAQQLENEAGAAYTAAYNYYIGIEPRRQQALTDFEATLAGFTLQASRLTAVQGMPDAGVDAELVALRKDNKEALADLWQLMSDAREKLGAEARNNEAINVRLKDVDDVTRTKIGLAFTSIFSSLTDAMKIIGGLLDPATNSGGSNFSERQPQRMRFAIGGSA